MDYYDLDAYNRARREKRNARAMLALGIAVVSLATYVNLRQGPPQRISGYIVGKEWTKAHGSKEVPQRVQEAGLLGGVFVPAAPVRFPVPSVFTIWVANPSALRPIEVDSASWFRLRCGQRYTYSYREGWL